MNSPGGIKTGGGGKENMVMLTTFCHFPALVVGHCFLLRALCLFATDCSGCFPKQPGQARRAAAAPSYSY